jgi:hypothetical protein
MPTNHLRVTKNYRQTIQASPEQVFPLLCPVREKEWLANWHYEMLYSESGLAETGAIFSTPEEDGLQAYWIIVRRDPESGEISFVKTIPDRSITQLDIRVSSGEQTQQSLVDIRYSHTGLNKKGDERVKSITDQVFNKRLKFWEDAMNHFLATGAQLQPHT